MTADRTHVLAWFPGDLLADDPEASGWQLYTRHSWESDGSYYEVGGGLDTPAEELHQLVAETLGLAVLELRPSTWRVEKVMRASGWEEGPWTYPAYDVVADLLSAAAGGSGPVLPGEDS